MLCNLQNRLNERSHEYILCMFYFIRLNVTDIKLIYKSCNILIFIMHIV